MLRQPLEPLKSPALSVCARACACAPADFHPLVDSITYSDYYLLANDFPDYIATQERIDQVYCDQAHWTKMSIMSTAGSGFFSSDRTIESVRGWGAAGGRAGGGGMAVVAAAVAVAWQWWRWLCGWVGRGGTWVAAGGWAGAVAEEQQLPLPCKLSGHWHLTAGGLCRFCALCVPAVQQGHLALHALPGAHPQRMNSWTCGSAPKRAGHFQPSTQNCSF